MSKVVLSEFSILDAQRNVIFNPNYDRFFRQNFLETGALTPIFGFINGCAFLIPKVYFDAYGGFDENYRAVQDYKKWFEMFRGRRLIYVRKHTSIYRSHPTQVSKNYKNVKQENSWLFHWMIQNIEPDDLVGSGLSDMYNFYSAAFTQWFGSEYIDAFTFCFNKMMELPESPDIEERTQRLYDFLNADNSETYIVEEEYNAIEFAFNLRGIVLPQKLKKIPLKDVDKVSNIDARVLRYYSFVQAFFDTPIRKKILPKLLAT